MHLDEFNDDDENDATKILIDPQDEAASRSSQTQHTTHDIAMKTLGRCGSVTAAAAAAVDIAVAVAVVAAVGCNGNSIKFMKMPFGWHCGMFDVAVSCQVWCVCECVLLVCRASENIFIAL